jgi:tetratricopeptide (TPR) repeat protein
MRDLLAHADLGGYARQFVWLELSYDEPQNRAFLTKYGANATPTFFVINPQNESVAAMQPGAMSLPELKQFLDRGAAAVHAGAQTAADTALVRGDALIAQRPADAANEYLEALRLAPADWSHHELAEASVVQALYGSKQWRQCADSALKYAGAMKRDVLFVRTVASAMWCVVSADPDPSLNVQIEALRPLAVEALSLPITVRDHRDTLYRTLMIIESTRNNTAAALKWGDRWLAELDAIKPRSDDERSALDIARVENIQVAGDPARIIPALRASEQAMPNSYIASLRLAQMELAAKQYDEALAACGRGLARQPGAFGRTWLLMIEAQALQEKGEAAEARKVLEQALAAAEQIPSTQGRENVIASIKKSLESLPPSH